MRHFCTVSDINYLPQALALYHSLLDKDPDFKLHYFCIDEQTFEQVKKYSNIVPYSEGIVKNCEALYNTKIREYKRYCWHLTPWFTKYISDTVGEVTYLDSDIFFHKNWARLFDEFGDRDIGIFRHRQFPYGQPRIEGYFNVGVMYFNSSDNARDVLSWWADAVVNNKYPNLATCGDQKYLDAFPTLCKAGKLFVDGDIGHGAPWQWQVYDFSEYLNSGKIIWEGVKQDLVFSHFSQFKIVDNSYIPSTQHHCYTPLEYYKSNPALKNIYDNYFKAVKKYG